MSYVVTSPKLENGAKLVGMWSGKRSRTSVNAVLHQDIDHGVQARRAEGAVSTLDKVIPRGESSRTSSRQCDCSAGR